MDRSSRPRRALRQAVLLCALVAAGACGGGDDDGRLVRPNIVLITIDTLRADHLGCYGYFRDTSPTMDALAKESVVFEQAYAAMATTLPSHTSMLTARYPLEHGILANIQHGGKPFGWREGMVSFAQLAKDAGYSTGAFVSAAALKSATGISAGFDAWTEPEDSQRRAGETLADALPWLAKQGDQPFFLWVHFYDPHWPHRAPAPYDTMFHSDEPDPKLEQWIVERGIGESALRVNAKKTTETRKALDNYCGEIRYTDAQVQVLLDALKSSGALDRSVLILTSDHGEGLNQHDWTSHGLVWEEQLRVPLMMRFPAAAGVAPRRVDALVSLVDILPTVLARVAPFESKLWTSFHQGATGVDVLAPGFVERPVFGQRVERELATDPGEMVALTTREWKYIHEPDVGDKLFDRRNDPHELVNLLEQKRETAERMHKLTMILRTHQEQRGAELGDAADTDVDPELLAELQKLGYAGGEDGRSGTDDQERAPPARDGQTDEPKKP
jgi:arylsulfatase A-like enzyme